MGTILARFQPQLDTRRAETAAPPLTLVLCRLFLLIHTTLTLSGCLQPRQQEDELKDTRETFFFFSFFGLFQRDHVR